MTEIPIPRTIDEVTPAWLTSVLRADGTLDEGTTITGVAPVEIGAGVGIMGQIWRLALSGDGGPRPASIVVKLPSTAEENRAQGIALGMYEAEVRFYNELAADTRTRIPGCHHAAIVPGTADFVMVMEDLGHLHLVEQAVGMTPAEAHAAVVALADLHASWWERVGTLDWVPAVNAPRIEMLAQVYPTLWPAFVANFGDVLPDGALELGERIAKNYWAIVQEFAKRPWTLAHQDFRVDNLMFGEGPGGVEVAVLDWQGLGRTPGIYDLSYLLGGSLTVEDRRQDEWTHVETYRDRLYQRGVEYQMADLATDYVYAQLLGGPATSVLTGATFDLANDRGRRMIATMAERHFTACLDLDAGSLIPE